MSKTRDMKKFNPGRIINQAMDRSEKWDPVFRTGTHISSTGVSRTWTEKELDLLIENFEANTPIVIRHPEDQTKALNFGKIARLKRVGEFLLAQYAEVPEILKMVVKQGLNLAKSVSIDPAKMKIRHIGLLGAGQPPAVEGLGPASFEQETDKDGKSHLIYTQINFEKETTVDPKDKKIQELEDEIKMLKAGKETEKLQGDLDHAGKALEKEKAAHAATRAEHEKFKQGQDEKALSDRVDRLAESGRIRPAEKTKVLAYAKAMDGETATMEFSAADGKKETVSPRENYLRDLEAQKPDAHGLLAEFAKPAAGNGNQATGLDVFKDINNFS